MAEPVEVRIRHGIMRDPLFGYRAIREANGVRTFLGPWTAEAHAQAIADEATRIAHEVIDSMDMPTAKGDTPLGIWTPRGTTE